MQELEGIGNAKLQNFFESIDSGNYQNFKKDLDNNLKEKYTEDEFVKLSKETKEKFGEYNHYFSIIILKHYNISSIFIISCS